ncbi:uncharacterized protein K02A2.6-like [Ornithodoros turicata]|uniref:uncharacterized protein K02A2.6-like n=1 Tax=Ornithodoros turicata TaxID=34597 RepID=UPI00313A1C06
MMYLLTVDYRSPEVFSLTSTTFESVIVRLKSVFARHGIPLGVIIDNGPQVSSASFEDFFKEYNSQHVTSSTYYPQSNGEVERMVTTIKQLFIKNSEPHIALLNYQNSSGHLEPSTAQLYMRRKPRTSLPVLTQKLLPISNFNALAEDRDRQYRAKQKNNYDKHYNACLLQPLEPNTDVRIRDMNQEAVVRHHAPMYSQNFTW